jgi:RNA polymerase sigma-70 factor (ECF subfamily)
MGAVSLKDSIPGNALTTYDDPHQEVVEACRKGDRQAQFELYKMYGKGMYNICLRMLGNAEDAEDVLQLAFVDVFRRLDQFRQESTIGAWIKRIVVNRCLDHLRKRKVMIESFDDQVHDVPQSEATNGSAELSYSVEDIQQAVYALPDGYRVVLTLYLFEGYDHEEISKILDISVSTSKSQYHRAKRKLRDTLAAC